MQESSSPDVVGRDVTSACARPRGGLLLGPPFVRPAEIEPGDRVVSAAENCPSRPDHGGVQRGGPVAAALDLHGTSRRPG